MKGVASKSILCIRFLILSNFIIAVIVLIVGSLLSVSGGYSIFEFNEDLYGALDNNLKMIMVYLAITETVILAYCLITKKFQAMILVGFFLILMIGSVEFYGEINSVAIDSNFPLFFLYTGLSHLLYGIMATLDSTNSLDENSGNLSE